MKLEISVRKIVTSFNLTNRKQPPPVSHVSYSTTWCGYCKRLKSQLADLRVAFQEIKINEVVGTAEIFEKVKAGNRMVPTLV